jgi:hypothetical protein
MARAICDVCGREAEFNPGYLKVADQEARASILGQCSWCLRFVCVRHAEPLEDGRLGCPFDPGLPLGDAPVREEST